MTEYINPPFEEDPSTIEERIYAYIQAIYPDWEPREAHLTTLLTEALASEISDLKRLAADTPTTIFRYFGSLVGIDPLDSSFATGSTTWTMIDNAGYTIPAGTTLRMLIGGEDYAAFETVDEVVVPPGSTATAAGEVQIVALIEGEAANNLSTTPELLDILDYVESVAIVGSTSGGSEAETDEDYLNRLSARLRLLADRPILPEDFEIYANTVTGVHRSLVLDGYDPVSATFDNEKMISIAAITEAGVGVSAGVKTEIQNTLEAVREVNFEVHVIDPTYTAITVVATVRAYPGYDTTDLDDRVTAAVTEYLNPASWGTRADETTAGWLLEDKVRYLEVAQAINNVQGVNYIESLTVNGGTVDVDLDGVAPLPEADPTVTITVNGA